MASPQEYPARLIKRPTSDSAGVKLIHVIGQTLHRRLDPSLIGPQPWRGGAVRCSGQSPTRLDIHLPAGAGFSQDLPADFHAALYTDRGVVDITATPPQKLHLAVPSQTGWRQPTERLSDFFVHP